MISNAMKCGRCQNLSVPMFIFMDPTGNKPEAFHGLYMYSFKILNSTTQFCDIHKAHYFMVSNLP